MDGGTVVETAFRQTGAMYLRQSPLSSAKRRADVAADDCLRRGLRVRLRTNNATPEPSESDLWHNYGCAI